MITMRVKNKKLQAKKLKKKIFTYYPESANRNRGILKNSKLAIGWTKMLKKGRKYYSVCTGIPPHMLTDSNKYIPNRTPIQ